MYFMVAPLSAGTAVVPLTRDVGATGPPRTSAARPASAPLPGAGQQPLAQGLVGGGVDRGPGHGQRAVDHRLVGGRGGALGGELGLVVDRREGVDADGGVDRGQGQGHVAHVGRPGAPVAPVGEAAPQGLGVALVQGGQLVVVAHLGIGRAVGGQLKGRPGGQGAGLEERVTLAWTSSSCSRFSARTIHLPSVWAGMMLAASPPLVTMPCTRSPGLRCWRSRPMAVWATTWASAALIPRYG